jgi:TonB-linked SusC/RagA family outer membrane protein
LVIEERVSFNKSTNFREIWNTSYPFVLLDTDLNQVGDVIQPQAGDRNLEIRSGFEKTINTLTTARYTKSIGQHNMNALIGFQTTEETSNELRAGRQGFILDNLQDLTLGLANSSISGDPLGNTSFAGTPRTTVSYFGRLGYDFKGKYLAELNFRADASSNFGPNNKWGYFPALSIGWNLIEEDFMSSVEFVDILKLRASWGKTGDDGSINVIETAEYAPSGVGIGDVAVPTIFLGTAINPDLKWETSQKTNFGLELTLWQGKLGFVGEYFIDNRSDIIRGVPTALETGLGNVLDNSFDAKTWGWEFDLSHKNNIGSVNYFANFNFSLYDSEITNLKDTGPFIDNEDYQAVGLPIRGNWFGYETDGFFDSQEEMDANVAEDGTTPIDQSAVSSQGDGLGRYLGGFKYIDQLTLDTNSDGIPDAKDGVITTDDRIVLKENTGDNKRIGFSLGASYKGFSLSARFYGVLQGYEWYRGDVLRPFTGDISPFAYQTDTWTVDNLDASYPQATASNVTPFSDRASHLIKDNAYIKMKNINLGYTFNQAFIDKLKVITGLDVYLSIENIGTIWTNSFAHDFGWDPELGLGNFDYPIPLTTSLGINVKF